ncbi:hypothetical protein K466DRAFT_587153, partial [Polyporus arcularius HHB13444]
MHSWLVPQYVVADGAGPGEDPQATATARALKLQAEDPASAIGGGTLSRTVRGSGGTTHNTYDEACRTQL